MLKTCKIKGGTLKEAIIAIFNVGCGGWCCYECDICGKYHIIKGK